MMKYEEGPCRICRATLMTKGACDKCANILMTRLLMGHVRAPCLACHRHHKGACGVEGVLTKAFKR